MYHGIGRNGRILPKMGRNTFNKPLTTGAGLFSFTLNNPARRNSSFKNVGRPNLGHSRNVGRENLYDGKNSAPPTQGELSKCILHVSPSPLPPR